MKIAVLKTTESDGCCRACEEISEPKIQIQISMTAVPILFEKEHSSIEANTLQ